MRFPVSTLSLFSALLLLSACSYTTQATSGRDWLAASSPSTVNMTPGDIDSAVRDAADVQPTLRFPARIGIARLDRGQLAAIPADEAKAWTDAAGRLGAAYGEFVPVSRLVAAMLKPARDPAAQVDWARLAIEEIRLASARQHLDAVIVYEVDATADSKSNPLSIAEWTLIGALVLPTENVKAEGAAQAILLDVRNGYPYGTVQADADDHSVSSRFKTNETGDSLKDAVRAEAVAKLAGETEAMLRKLSPELAALDRKQAR
jgi:hypothetical protein